MEFGSSGFPEIRAIFLAQFHPDQGPIVRLSIPEDAVDAGPRTYSGSCTGRSDDNPGEEPQTATESDGGRHETHRLVELIKRPPSNKPVACSGKIDFNSIQAMVIPKLTLFERLITVDTGRYKVMCYPIAVEGNYVRNVFIFNMCFAFDIDADTMCYGPVVKRMGCLLKELETTGRLLSDPGGSRPLKTMMRQLVSKLNDHGEYQIELDLKGLLQPIAATGFSIKLFPYYKNPRNIEPYHVPVKQIDFELAKCKSAQTVYQQGAPGDVLWDLVLDRVTQCIDNVNHVRRIAKLAQIEEETVILALKHLDYYGCIALVDVFQFSNVYEAQHSIRDLFRDGKLQRECQDYVVGDAQDSTVRVGELLGLYASIGQRKTVAEWIVDNNVDVERLDVRRFVVFGIINNFLRRVHCYPVLCETRSDGKGRDNTPDSSAEGGLDPRTLEMLDGTHTMDEISIVADRDSAALRKMLDQHGGVEYIYM
ncbi:Nitrogen permease regulator 2 [Coemansia biformis]|uniref:Nitrogen permease regulator 2 n=1 Tax=Coemansia biformis TaxID=1286918 RepID=A0A9W8CXJ0_9FUNG|nr:Nitrogen permease regulator 2 [Coemansia biformis]